ncbi:unnamed protein product [Cunninghamella blakesleeana]
MSYSREPEDYNPEENSNNNVIFPFIGKWLGRKCSFWIWSRWTHSPQAITSSNFLSIQWINSLKRISQ